MNPYETFGSPTEDAPTSRFTRDEEGYGRQNDGYRRRSPSE